MLQKTGLKLPIILINIAEFLPLSNKKKVFDAFKTFYQQKISLLLFAAITKRPNIAFVVSRLPQFNQQLGKIYYKVAN